MFTTSKQGAVDLIGGDSPITKETCPALADVLTACMHRGQPRVVLDLSRVSLIDSRGLEFLLEAQEDCQRRGGCLKLSGPSKLCRTILLVTGVGAKFEIHAESATAAGSFAQ